MTDFVAILCGSGMAAVVAGLFGLLSRWLDRRSRKKDKQATSGDAVSRGMRAMLRDRVRYLGHEYLHARRIDYQEREDITAEAVDYYEYRDGVIRPDPDREELRAPHDFGSVPFVGWKNNHEEQGDLHAIRALIDDYDRTRSDNANMLDNMRKLYIVLKGYGGTDLSGFRRNLDMYGVISIDDTNGGAEAINNPSDLSGFDKHFEQLQSDIVEFGQGVNRRTEDMGAAPSGVALKFLYAKLDLKCNKLEVEFRRAFGTMLRLLAAVWEVPDTGATLVFNRDVSINEAEAITMCGNSKGIVSDRTILEQHPWVENVDDEVKRIAEEQAAALGDDWRVDAPAAINQPTIKQGGE